MPPCARWSLWRGRVGGVNGFFVPSPHPYPCLSDERKVGSEEVLDRGPCLGCPVDPSLFQRDNILFSIRRQVSGDIYTLRGRYCCGGLGVTPWSFANRRSTPPEAFIGCIRNILHLPRYCKCLVGAAPRR